MKYSTSYKNLTLFERLPKLPLLALLSLSFLQTNTEAKASLSVSNTYTIPADSAKPATESDYYKIVSVPIPEGVFLEVGGLATLPDGRLAVSTRRGEVWLIENPYMTGQTRPYFKRFAFGLHEPLGLAYTKGVFYLSQRGEVTRLIDQNGDDRADVYERVYAWPLSGNYHEYSYGPHIMPDGNLLVTLNLAWVGKGASLTKWRGWMLKITPDGQVTPIATGMRSPAGYGLNSAGDIFYAENQGDWVGSGRITHVESGDFVGNPAGLAWTDEPGSPLKLKPQDIPDTGEPLYKVAKSVPALKPPAVWFPQGLMGISTSDILEDNTNGAFGPFSGQLFVGDQGHSKVMRVYMEKVKGEYQGACFPFREGFASGLLRMVWGNDGSMFAGMTSRGWSSTGKDDYGLQRLVWTGKTPFEIKTMRAQPDGFELEFTVPVNRQSAEKLASYKITSFNYKYHHNYGSPVIEQQNCEIKGIVVSEDGLKARIVVDGLREGYIHELRAEGVRSNSLSPLLHNFGYYTLNNIPEGAKLALTETASTKTHASHSGTAAKATVKTTSAQSETTKTASTAKRVTKQPAFWIKGPEATITIGTKPGLKFDLPQFEVKAGSRVKVVFNNNDDMLHNFVVVQPGSAIKVGDLAVKLGLDGQSMNYIPKTDLVLYHTAILQPETSEAIYFTAPTKPGEYTYVCTFPGHSYVMQGTMIVVAAAN